MNPALIMAIAKGAKSAITDRADALASGMAQAGSIYGANGGFGGGNTQQQVEKAPMFQPSQMQSNPSNQYSFLPESSKYVPNTDFAQRVAGKQPNKLFQFLSQGSNG